MRPTLEQLNQYKRYLEKVAIKEKVIELLQTTESKELKDDIRGKNVTDIEAIAIEVEYNSNDEGGSYASVTEIEIAFVDDTSLTLNGSIYEDEDKIYDFLYELSNYAIIEQCDIIEYKDLKEPFKLIIA